MSLQYKQEKEIDARQKEREKKEDTTPDNQELSTPIGYFVRAEAQQAASESKPDIITQANVQRNKEILASFNNYCEQNGITTTSEDPVTQVAAEHITIEAELGKLAGLKRTDKEYVYDKKVQCNCIGLKNEGEIICCIPDPKIVAKMSPIERKKYLQALQSINSELYRKFCQRHATFSSGLIITPKKEHAIIHVQKNVSPGDSPLMYLTRYKDDITKRYYNNEMVNNTNTCALLKKMGNIELVAESKKPVTSTLDKVNDTQIHMINFLDNADHSTTNYHIGIDDEIPFDPKRWVQPENLQPPITDPKEIERRLEQANNNATPNPNNGPAEAVWGTYCNRLNVEITPTDPVTKVFVKKERVEATISLFEGTKDGNRYYSREKPVTCDCLVLTNKERPAFYLPNPQIYNKLSGDEQAAVRRGIHSLNSELYVEYCSKRGNFSGELVRSKNGEYAILRTQKDTPEEKAPLMYLKEYYDTNYHMSLNSEQVDITNERALLKTIGNPKFLNIPEERETEIMGTLQSISNKWNDKDNFDIEVDEARVFDPDELLPKPESAQIQSAGETSPLDQSQTASTTDEQVSLDNLPHPVSALQQAPQAKANLTPPNIGGTFATTYSPDTAQSISGISPTGQSPTASTTDERVTPNEEPNSNQGTTRTEPASLKGETTRAASTSFVEQQTVSKRPVIIQKGYSLEGQILRLAAGSEEQLKEECMATAMEEGVKVGALIGKNTSKLLGESIGARKGKAQGKEVGEEAAFYINTAINLVSNPDLVNGQKKDDPLNTMITQLKKRENILTRKKDWQVQSSYKKDELTELRNLIKDIRNYQSSGDMMYERNIKLQLASKIVHYIDTKGKNETEHGFFDNGAQHLLYDPSKRAYQIHSMPRMAQLMKALDDMQKYDHSELEARVKEFNTTKDFVDGYLNEVKKGNI